MIERVRERSPNLRGLKVSDTPFSAVEPYLATDGMDVFIGSEPLVLEGLEAGAIGAVSGLASAFPEIAAALVHDRSERAARAGRLAPLGAPGDPVPRGGEGGAGCQGSADVGRRPRAAARSHGGRTVNVLALARDVAGA